MDNIIQAARDFNEPELKQYTDPAVNPSYYSYFNKDGTYFIKKLDTTAFTVGFFKNQDNFTADWTNRASLSYS